MVALPVIAPLPTSPTTRPTTAAVCAARRPGHSLAAMDAPRQDEPVGTPSSASTTLHRHIGHKCQREIHVARRTPANRRHPRRPPPRQLDSLRDFSASTLARVELMPAPMVYRSSSPRAARLEHALCQPLFQHGVGPREAAVLKVVLLEPPDGEPEVAGGAAMRAVTSDVAGELRLPVGAVGVGHAAVLRAAVVEAPVRQDHEAKRQHHDVGNSWQRAVVLVNVLTPTEVRADELVQAKLDAGARTPDAGHDIVALRRVEHVCHFLESPR